MKRMVMMRDRRRMTDEPRTLSLLALSVEGDVALIRALRWLRRTLSCDVRDRSVRRLSKHLCQLRRRG